MSATETYQAIMARYPGQSWQQHAQAPAQQAISDPGQYTGSGSSEKTAEIASEFVASVLDRIGRHYRFKGFSRWGGDVWASFENPETGGTYRENIAHPGQDEITKRWFQDLINHGAVC